MARKNRSNNSFAPIVITVLVAGVVGYYAFIKAPPQSTLADEAIHSGGNSEDPSTGQRPQPSLGSTLEFRRPSDFSSQQSSAGRGSRLTEKPDASRNPLGIATGRAANSPLERAATTDSPLVPNEAGPDGLGPTPTGSPPEPTSSGSTRPSGTESKTVTTSESNGESSDPKTDAKPKSEPKPEVAPAPKRKPETSTEVYTVQADDFIITIALDWFGESGRHDEILALNPLVDPKKLQIGQILKMPPKSQPRTKPIDPTLAPNEYRIAPNDNYSKIARLILGDEARASEITALNPDLDPVNLPVGIIIKLPPKRVKKPEAQPVKRPPLRAGEKYYTVSKGDSLARIVGDLWGVQREDWVELLYQRNKDTIGEDRTRLSLDQILIIPVKPKS